MNELTIIGNLTAEPTRAATKNGKEVCNFTVAVNRRSSDGNAQADYFRCGAWGKLADIAGQYLHKGSKVCVIGQVSCSGYTGKNGQIGANMDVFVEKLEMLTPKGDADDSSFVRKNAAPAPAPAAPMAVECDDLPF